MSYSLNLKSEDLNCDTEAVLYLGKGLIFFPQGICTSGPPLLSPFEVFAGLTLPFVMAQGHHQQLLNYQCV